MYRLLFYFLFCFLATSCLPEPDPLPGPTPDLFNCTLEYKIVHCPILSCEETQNLADQIVEIFTTEADALNGENALFEDTTNLNGWVKFYDLSCYDLLFVKIVFEDHGTYLARFNMGSNSNISLTVRTLKNMSFENGSVLKPNVKHISLKYPAIRQESHYREFIENDNLSFSPNIVSTGNTLRLIIGNQLDETTFNVLESSSSLGGVHNNWQIKEDSIIITSSGSIGIFRSFIWGINEELQSSSGRRAFPLGQQTDHFLDMNQDVELPLSSWFGHGIAEDFTIDDFLFEDLIVSKRMSEAVNNPVKFQIYNEEYGVIRSLQLMEDGTPKTKGYDLVLE